MRHGSLIAARKHGSRMVGLHRMLQRHADTGTCTASRAPANRVHHHQSRTRLRQNTINIGRRPRLLQTEFGQIFTHRDNQLLRIRHIHYYEAMTILNRLVAVSTLALAAICAGGAGNTAPSISFVRVPVGGIEPEVEVRDGIVHLLYFSGEAEHGDLFYARSRDYGQTFSTPIRVNKPGSAIAVGAIRGAQLAIGRNGRAHVAWNGSDQAQPRNGKEPPMLYTRLNDAGTAFEPEKNLITSSWGLNGGGSLAADQNGNVYVFWHAPPAGISANEENRKVWMAKSTDDGKTFAKETIAADTHTGVCGCCGMHAFAGADGTISVLFRSVLDNVHRDMYLLTSRDQGRSFQAANVSKWNIGACVMSAEAFAQMKDVTLAAWETEKQIYFGRIVNGTVAQPIGAPGTGENRKYPALAMNARGESLLAWTEGTAWKKAGSLAWQVYDQNLKTESSSAGHADGLAVWSFPAAYAKPDGNFVIVY